MTPRLSAFILVAGLAAAAALPRRRLVVIPAPAPSVSADRVWREMMQLRLGHMPSRSIH